jgi:hypothetical protein
VTADAALLNESYVGPKLPSTQCRFVPARAATNNDDVMVLYRCLVYTSIVLHN